MSIDIPQSGGGFQSKCNGRMRTEFRIDFDGRWRERDSDYDQGIYGHLNIRECDAGAEDGAA